VKRTTFLLDMGICELTFFPASCLKEVSKKLILSAVH